MTPTATYKDRLCRAIEQASKILSQRYEIGVVKHPAFNLMAIRRRETLLIRVVLDKVTPDDEAKVRAAVVSDSHSREIWVKKKGVHDFQIREY